MAGIIVTSMASRLTTSLREAPATLLGLVAVVPLVIWATDQAGYPVTHWAPGGVIVLALLALALASIGLRAREVPTPIRLALGCLAAYTALSFLSILWAGVPGDAWEGANRTLLYLLVFALFACWRQNGRAAALLLVVWALAMVVVAGFVALHVSSASGSALMRMLPFGRLVYPTGYANANAALWLTAFWPALLLARSGWLPWALRGVLAGGAVLLAEVALLSQSRGALYATPIMLVLVFALVRGRARTFAILALVAAGIAATAPTVLRVGNHLQDNRVSATTLHTAVGAMFISAVVVGLLVALAAAVEQRQMLSDTVRTRLRRAIGVGALVTLLALLGGGWAAVGDPLARLRHGWDTFRSVKGYAANSSGNRLTSGLGSNRYDFYRVALDEFLSHPVAGIGADNYEQQYLLHGRSHETPHYPHSVQLRTLTETGVVGSVVALAGLAAALLAAWRASRGSRERDALAPDVAVAAMGGFAYWLVHGSFDWFWEFAGLGGPAFALLGLACALVPRAPTDTRAPTPPARAPRIAIPPLRAGERRSVAPRVAAAAGVLAALLAAASLIAPWLSQRQIQSAASIWTRAPRKAYARLQDAAALNPLSDQAYLVAGSIALRYGDVSLADRRFSQALTRSPDDAYATLERGAIASSEGQQAAALRLLGRAARLQPRDMLTRRAFELARRGRPVSLSELNRSILSQAQQLR
jgi:tetratricopeptide (TPR) repeat protein